MTHGFKWFFKGPAILALFTLVASGAVTINTKSVPGGTVGQPYSAGLSASGGVTPYVWSISGGALPPGTSLSSGGAISGSPTSTGTFNFTAKATDSGMGKSAESDTQGLSIVVVPAPSITTSSLAGGQAGVSYSQSLQATGGTTPYSWSISAGALPAGLSLSGAQISGTPTSAGSASFTVRVVDANSVAATRALSIAIAPPAVSVTTGSLADGQVGVAYSQSLQASGGTGSYSWSISAGALPAGLSLSSSGQISGTPSRSGSSSFTVKATDTGSGSATRALAINVTAAPVVVSTASLFSGQVAVPYSAILQASGGTPPYTWSVSSGGLPAGLSLSSSGVISGTPSAVTTGTFSVRATDSTGSSGTASLSLSVIAGVSAGACPAGTGIVGQPYSASLTASGGTSPYTWAVSSGQLPTGLTLNWQGQIAGTPTATGTFAFGARVTDHNSGTATVNCSIAISAAAPLSIGNSSFPDGTAGISYAQSLSGTGGRPPYAWSIAGGALPPGLGLNSGQVSGTPTTAGTFTFTVRLSDSASQSTTRDLSIRIGSALSIITAALAPVRTGVAVTQQLSASGGAPPYSWSLRSGALPAGLTLSATGSISGTPTVPGTSSFNVRVSDSAAVFAERAFTLDTTASLTITACPVSNATQGLPYSSTATASGGLAPFVWTLASGSLPSGVSFSAPTGGITGVPTEPGSFSYTLLITDKAGATATRACQLAVGSSLTIGTLVLADASPSAPYSQTLLVSGGKAPYAWTLASGALPVGLALSSGGTISGVPVQVGSYSFTVAVADANGARQQQALTMNVVTGLSVISCPMSTGEVGLPFNSAVSGSGGTPPYSWTMGEGSLPVGFTIFRFSGVVSGTPLQAGISQFSVILSDSANRSASRQCSLEIRLALSISTSALNAGTSGSSFLDSISILGGVAPYVWSTTAGALPPGVSLNATTGRLSGTPLIAGTFSFTAQVTDGMGAQAMKELSILISQGLTISDCPLPAGVIGQSYSSILSVAGGSLPYQWRIDSGALPAGLALDSQNASIAGTPLQPGLSTYVLRVDDANAKSTIRLCSIQINSAALSITTLSALPTGFLGVSYSQTLAASGGRTPYSWSIPAAGAPAGISIDADGTLTGVPASTGSFSFTVQATDQDNNVARAIMSLTIFPGTPPDITITGLPDIVDPALQPTFNLQLNSEYPADISGTITLVFSPDPAVGIDDPAVRFAAGGRVLKFTVPAHSIQAAWTAPVVAFQSGTVAGSIQLKVKLESDGVDITPADSASRTIRVDRLAPRIVKVAVVQTATGFDVHVTGFATTREIAQGIFRFSGDSGGNPAEIAVPLGDSSRTWFQSATAGAFGGQFGLTQTFTWQGQPAVVLNSVSVSLTNAQGSSAAMQAKF